MKTIKYLLMLPVALFLYSCGVIKCAAFPDNLSGWAPYKTNDILVYASGRDTIFFNVKDVSKTAASSISSTCDCLCSSPQAGFSTDSSSLGIAISATCDVEPAGLHYSFTSKKYKDNLSYDYVSNVNADSLSYNLNGTEISHVLAVTNETINLVKKIYLHKGMGLIGFIDKNNKEYKLVVK